MKHNRASFNLFTLHSMDKLEIQCRKELLKEYEKALERAGPIGKLSKHLLPYELDLIDKGLLKNITHKGASSIWLEAPSFLDYDLQTHTNVYRPMGDSEVQFLIDNNQLPDDRPYQAIIEGQVGRIYSTKYLTGVKHTDTFPSTVVEFTCPKPMIEAIKKVQIKIEDGALSMGLGDKAGKQLPVFNQSIRNGETTWRIVKVKRSPPIQSR
ncbi:hypothetical protein DFA_04432 [Cavenderia fasciculata]|uniref:Uncharacterized protein n=1 Tax=Cavenderia fasciculata TaxID=261658 RepID=F4PPK1_CACFS|nr:uncharacterized protein DFA_04432 [Cavenderia fasciculata]EGG22314.1 hypothetical protein DFA_04432 [Cavenderia fasciculata]|eukprot:XP_004360165.1 hypothetical protein DFA_04432 [Cavenderia fasciculata]